MRTIFEQFSAGMDNIYNSFYLSFLSLKVLGERPLSNDYYIPISGFSFNHLEAERINSIQMDSVNEYVNAIRRHLLNDIVICYERYATTMYASFCNGMIRTDPAKIDDRGNNPSKFEKIEGLYTKEEKEFFVQLRHLRNSIVHYNGVYSKTNPLNYTFYKNYYNSDGHEGEPISVELDSLMYILTRTRSMVERINKVFFEQGLENR